MKILAIVVIGLTSELKIEKLRHYPYYYLLLALACYDSFGVHHNYGLKSFLEENFRILCTYGKMTEAFDHLH